MSDMKIYKNEERKDCFCIIPVERNSVTLFAIKNNELKVLKEKQIFIDKEVVLKYLKYFLEKYFAGSLIENKLKMGHRSYKGTANFELDGKHNFYTLDDIKLMKDELEHVAELLSSDYENIILEDYKEKVIKAIDMSKDEIEEVITFYKKLLVYLSKFLKLDEDKYVISFINRI